MRHTGRLEAPSSQPIRTEHPPSLSQSGRSILPHSEHADPYEALSRKRLPVRAANYSSYYNPAAAAAGGGGSESAAASASNLQSSAHASETTEACICFVSAGVCGGGRERPRPQGTGVVEMERDGEDRITQRKKGQTQFTSEGKDMGFVTQTLPPPLPPLPPLPHPPLITFTGGLMLPNTSSSRVSTLPCFCVNLLRSGNTFKMRFSLLFHTVCEFNTVSGEKQRNTGAQMAGG
ncbi:unnamed protein product [Pleuronectes platessa]|uniref:Uncharacterized protein n=1 Tax=Pleuronectes platessa TaxID=8262 RepID=A0A9N7UGH5_PLEPL|nr:unnamed protein product [Pleuronectes platessa]